MARGISTSSPQAAIGGNRFWKLAKKMKKMGQPELRYFPCLR
jgi:hypothetical protein